MGLRKSSVYCAIVGMILAAGAQAVLAVGPVTIPNGSFETPDASGVPVFHSLPIMYQTDWVHAPQPGDYPYPSDSFAWDNNAGVFNNASFAATPNFVSGVDGAQAGFFFNTFHNEITQELAATWQPGSVYHLSLSAQGGGQAMPLGAQLQITLYYLDGLIKTPVSSFLVTNTFDNPTAQPISALVGYGFDTDVIPGALAGKAIGISISSPATSYSGGDFGYWDIDNVQLTELPEPASLGILAAGGMGLLIRRRRRA